MVKVNLRFEDGAQEVQRFTLPLSIGRSSDCGLRIKAWRVGRTHAIVDSRHDGIYIEDLGSLSGTLVNGRRVSEYGPLSPLDEVIIGPCLMLVSSEQFAPPDASAEPATEVAGRALPGEGPGCERNPAEEPLRDVRMQSPALHHDPQSPGPLYPPVPSATSAPHRRRLHAALLASLDLRRRDIANMSDAALRDEARAVLAEIIADDPAIPDEVDKSVLLQEVVDEAVGLGPIEPLLADPSISEIMVNRYNEIYVEQSGKLTRHAAIFSSEQAVMGIIERIVSPLGRRIDESSPMVDARLKDGSRVNAIIPPIALRGASITIRKFPLFRPAMQDLVRAGSLDEFMSAFLRACVRGRKNIVVSGGTGSGKTTLLNVLSNCIPEDERVVTIEDAAELRLNHSNLVTLEARPANLEGRGRVDIRDLVRNALRMRPDRIVVGECRGGEAFDMLAAMNTGHEGSLTTLHANSPRDALARLETMILMAGMDLPLAAVREHIAASIEIIVQQARLSSGRRLITSIVEITGIEAGRIQTQELFRFEAGCQALFLGCGLRPDCMTPQEMQSLGLETSTFCQRTLIGETSASLASTVAFDNRS